MIDGADAGREEEEAGARSGCSSRVEVPDSGVERLDPRMNSEGMGASTSQVITRPQRDNHHRPPTGQSQKADSLCIFTVKPMSNFQINPYQWLKSRSPYTLGSTNSTWQLGVPVTTWLPIQSRCHLYLTAQSKI